jgi:hypothetical protein
MPDARLLLVSRTKTILTTTWIAPCPARTFSLIRGGAQVQVTAVDPAAFFVKRDETEPKANMAWEQQSAGIRCLTGRGSGEFYGGVACGRQHCESGRSDGS